MHSKIEGFCLVNSLAEFDEVVEDLKKTVEGLKNVADGIEKYTNEEYRDESLTEPIEYYDPFDSIRIVSTSIAEGFKLGVLNSISMELEREPKERTISDIKKEIKHERNPLRLKQLNRELNAKYKELKRGRK